MNNYFKYKWSAKFLDESNNLIYESKSNPNGNNSHRIVFSVKQLAPSGHISYTELMLYNLDATIRNKLLKAKYIELSAGWQEIGLSLLTKCKITNSLFQHTQTDGMISFYGIENIPDTPISLSIPKNSSILDILNLLKSKFSYLIIKDSNIKAKATLNNDCCFKSANLIKLLADISKELVNAEINVINSELIVSPNNRDNLDYAFSFENNFIINYKNGLIGSPSIDIKNAGIKLDINLNGFVIPNTIVKVETINPLVNYQDAKFVNYRQNAFREGNWLVYRVSHNGDSRSDMWRTIIEGFTKERLINT